MQAALGSNPQHHINQMWQCMPVIEELGGWRRIVSSRSSSATQDQVQSVICETWPPKPTDKKEGGKERHNKLPIKIKIKEMV